MANLSLLAEALFLEFADGRKESLFSPHRTLGKEPLLAGKANLCSWGILRARAFILAAKPRVNANSEAKLRENWQGIK